MEEFFGSEWLLLVDILGGGPWEWRTLGMAYWNR